jgi:hypothetical protein
MFAMTPANRAKRAMWRMCPENLSEQAILWRPAFRSKSSGCLPGAIGNGPCSLFFLAFKHTMKLVPESREYLLQNRGLAPRG